MLVCVCHGISDRDITSALEEGVSSFKELRAQSGLATACGQCAQYAKDMLNEKMAELQQVHAFHLATEIRL